MCGFDKSNPYEIYEKVACPLFYALFYELNLQPIVFEVPVNGFLNSFLQGILRLKR
jgi:hypothetical protein